ncbi:MAG: hypothetical protein Q9192_003451 [Flavoplaca navasiana]
MPGPQKTQKQIEAQRVYQSNYRIKQKRLKAEAAAAAAAAAQIQNEVEIASSRDSPREDPTGRVEQSGLAPSTVADTHHHQRPNTRSQTSKDRDNNEHNAPGGPGAAPENSMQTVVPGPGLRESSDPTTAILHGFQSGSSGAFFALAETFLAALQDNDQSIRQDEGTAVAAHGDTPLSSIEVADSNQRTANPDNEDRTLMSGALQMSNTPSPGPQRSDNDDDYNPGNFGVDDDSVNGEGSPGPPTIADRVAESTSTARSTPRTRHRFPPREQTRTNEAIEGSDRSTTSESTSGSDRSSSSHWTGLRSDDSGDSDSEHVSQPEARELRPTGNNDRSNGARRTRHARVDEVADEANEENWIHVARTAEKIRLSWMDTCSCKKRPPPLTGRCCTMTELSDHWREKGPQPSYSLLPMPLSKEKYQGRIRAYTDDSSIRWQALLGDETCSLDMERSSLEPGNPTVPHDLRYYRVWDVDSFLARPTTITVHRHGFNWCYRPPMQRRITQNQHVRFGGYDIHKLKNMRLGSGLMSSGCDYHCHVFFPHLPIGKSIKGINHPSDQQQEVWLDQIVFPALRRSCPSDLLQHHPRSFAEVWTKANARMEAYPDSWAQPMDVKYAIPSRYLEAFWHEVLSICNSGNFPHYKDLFIIITGHDLKRGTKRAQASLARLDFLKHLEEVFDTRQEYLPPMDTWLDFGYEDTPRGTAQEAYTFLRKNSCLDEWMTSFESPVHKTTLITPERYAWAMTRDAGSAGVSLGLKNLWHQKGGLAHAKSYNLHKDLFATPSKGHTAFGLPAFETLGYSQTMLDRWYQCNMLSHTRKDKRERLIKGYEMAKQRVAAALTATVETNFGVRCEYRINILLFQELRLDSLNYVCRVSEDAGLRASTVNEMDPLGTSREPWRDNPSNSTQVNFQGSTFEHPATLPPKFTSVNSGLEDDISSNEDGRQITSPHINFFILKTRDVNRYIAADTNRWILCLEALMARVEQGIDGLAPDEQAEQMVNGYMVSTVIRTLRLTINGSDPKRSPELWKSVLRTKRKGVPAAGEGEDPAEAPLRRGLNFQRSLSKYGIVWLPSDLIAWEKTPTYKPGSLRQLALARNAFFSQLKNNRQVQQNMAEERTILSIFRNDAQDNLATGSAEDRQITFQRGAELVLSQFVRDVWSILSERHLGKNKRAEVHRAWLLEHLDEGEADGYQGLTPSLVAKVVQGPIRYVTCCRRPTGENYRNRGVANFQQYNTGSWKDKLKGLFGTDDLPPTATRKRKWDNYKFRVLLRQLGEIVRQTWDHDATTIFMETLFCEAARTLWIIPHYRLDQLSPMYKATKQNSARTQTTISGMTPLARTNWMVPQIPSEYHTRLQRIDAALGRGQFNKTARGWQKNSYDDIRQELLHGEELQVMEDEALKYDKPTQGVIKDPIFYELHLTMNLALDHRIEAVVDVVQDVLLPESDDSEATV